MKPFSDYADKILEEQYKQAAKWEEIKQKRDEAAVKAIEKTFTEQSERIWNFK